MNLWCCFGCIGFSGASFFTDAYYPGKNAHKKHPECVKNRVFRVQNRVQPLQLVDFQSDLWSIRECGATVHPMPCGVNSHSFSLFRRNDEHAEVHRGACGVAKSCTKSCPSYRVEFLHRLHFQFVNNRDIRFHRGV